MNRFNGFKQTSGYLLSLFHFFFLFFFLIALQNGVFAQGNVTHERLLDDDDGKNWLSWGRTYKEQRFSPLHQINQDTVAELGLAWSFDLETYRGVEGTPIVVDGVIYTTSAWTVTRALDAKSGKLLWEYDPQTPRAWGRYACCGPVSRGLAVWEGKVIIGTLDGKLIGLDAASGEEVWEAQTTDTDWPYTITGAPRVFNGTVLVGNGGADFGVRGFVSAWDAHTGEFKWRFHTVPGNPEDGFENEAMRMAAETWNGEWWTLGGGGTVWDSIVYDPALNLVYIGTGNGSPLAIEFRSPGGGDNLFLASIVALDLSTGEYVWHYQEVPGEKWDYTATQPMILADLTIHGEERQVIMQAPKNGFFYVLDRATGELISAREFVPNTWASHIDMLSGRPMINPEADFGTQTVLITPGAGGGHNWEPMSYSPVTGLVYFTAQEDWISYSVAREFTPRRFRSNPGWGFESNAERRDELTQQATQRRSAWLTAWDPVKQREVWRVPHSNIGSGGTLATAGNLVAQGNIDKQFVIYRADNGEKLWSMDIQTVALAGPVSYEVDGEQYIAVNAGWGGGRAIVARATGEDFPVAPARLLVFKLGGNASLPAMETLSQAMPPQPPPLRANEEVVELGARLFTETCAQCHGQNAIGGLKDLRYMSMEAHNDFSTTVLQGTLEEKGMASFADILNEQQVDAIHAYIIARANESWGNDLNQP